jgi:hypothetical protein
MITKEQLRQFLWDSGLMPSEGMFIVDELYVFPSQGWVRDTFLPAWSEYKKNLESVGVSMRWRAEVKDCDEFAAKMSDYARDLHARTWRDREPAALCFGWMAYRRFIDGQGHAINFTICQGEQTHPQLLFIDGGEDAVVSLIWKEVESCFALYV